MGGKFPPLKALKKHWGEGGNTFCTAHVTCTVESLSSESSLIGTSKSVSFPVQRQPGKFSLVSDVRVEEVQYANGSLELPSAISRRWPGQFSHTNIVRVEEVQYAKTDCK